MLRPAQELSEGECYAVEQRILSDAELIRRGATVTAAGTLALGDNQIERLRLQEEFPYFDPEWGYDAPMALDSREDWLDTTVNVALAPRYQTEREIPQPLRRMDMSIRDVLVLGRDYVDSSATPQVGAKSIGIIDLLIAENGFGLEWKDSPTPEDIAHICQRLDQVTAKALRLDLGFGLISEPSVLNVVRMSLDERARLWKNNLEFPHSPHARDELFNYPEVFASRFERERMDIKYSEQESL